MSPKKQADLVRITACLVSCDNWPKAAQSMAAAAIDHVRALSDIHQRKIAQHTRASGLASKNAPPTEEEWAAQEAEGEACSDLVLTACAYGELFLASPVTLTEYHRLLKELGDDHLYHDVTTLVGWNGPENAAKKARHIQKLRRTLK